MIFDDRQTRFFVVIALLVGLLAIPTSCGEEPEPETSPFEGTYKVIQHTRNTDGCDSQGSAYPSGDDYFQLSLASDGEVLAYTPCNELDECAGASVSDSGSFEERDGEHWKRVNADIVDVLGGCTIEMSERIAMFEGDDDVRIEARTYEGTPERENHDIECNEDFARERQDDLECTRLEVMLAVPVE